MKDVSGKVAVVTGGGSGIGRAIAMALAGEGARIAVADIIEANAVAVAAEIASLGGEAMAFGCDVSDRASVRAMNAEVGKRLGAASILIANAGVTMFKPLLEMSDDDIDWVIQVDLFGVLNCLQVFLPDMVAAREGHVLATSSMSALVTPFIANHVSYAAAKCGVFGTMLNMRRELEGSGVGVSVLCPGGVVTHITDSPRYRPERFGGPEDASVTLPRAAKSTEQVRMRPAEEVAQMVLRGIRHNEAVIVTDDAMRDHFEQGIVSLTMQAFDKAREFDEQQAGAPAMAH
jgi:NAD(P)-dependent dehydrogenase (short-subunit alcohol dehydrogenase family)